MLGINVLRFKLSSVPSKFALCLHEFPTDHPDKIQEESVCFAANRHLEQAERTRAILRFTAWFGRVFCSSESFFNVIRVRVYYHQLAEAKVCQYIIS